MLSQIVAVFQYSSPFWGPPPPSLPGACRGTRPCCSIPWDGSGCVCRGWMFFPRSRKVYVGCFPKYTFQIHFGTARSKAQIAVNSVNVNLACWLCSFVPAVKGTVADILVW